MLLEINGLHVSYGSVPAVVDVALKVDDGDVVTVLGANGAGKTSLLRAIMGTAASVGEVRYAGDVITRWPASRRVAAGIAHVPEGRSILVSLSVEENLLMGAYQRRDRDIPRDLAQVYDLFPNLAQRRTALGSVLSGGEQQMLAIGRAMMSRPKLLLMDEPSLGLSPLFVREVFKLIRSMNQNGLSILLVEQNTRLALQTATYGYVLRLGRCVAAADTPSLLGSGDLMRAYLGVEQSDATSSAH